jgi:Apea-like HEPN
MTSDKHALSRYMRTTHLFRTSVPLTFSDETEIRLFTPEESQQLWKLTRQQNVFARHTGEDNFYLKRIKAMANKTIIEVFRPGDPDDMIRQAEDAAEWAEKVALLSSSLAIRRKELYKLIGVEASRPTVFDLTIGPAFYCLRSKSRTHKQGDGILVDKTFVSRFNKCGFQSLFSMCMGRGGMSERMRLVVGWLFESRQENHLAAALVKTAIALESLLIFSESESLARTLSERAAFILSPDPQVRETISRIVKQFYETRSGVVHGSPKKAKKPRLHLVEGMDRLVLLLCIIIANNAVQWNSKEALQAWCEKERWGSPSSTVTVPYPAKHLTNAMNICVKDATLD